MIKNNDKIIMIMYRQQIEELLHTNNKKEYLAK